MQKVHILTSFTITNTHSFLIVFTRKHNYTHTLYYLHIYINVYYGKSNTYTHNIPLLIPIN